jgi:hypothetical protein
MTTYDEMHVLFNNLTESEQVDIMVDFYYSMRDSQKDKFLDETENA